MDVAKIENLLRRCDIKELQNIEKFLLKLIEQTSSDIAQLSDEVGREQRREDRFNTNLLGTLTRVTDVKPGERKEYSVTIQDVSRSGMCLKVDVNFLPSRVIEVTFASLNGKIKRCFVEIVRMRKMNNENGQWIEIGCRSINNEEVRRIRLQEEQVAKTRSKLHSRRGVLILLVGTEREISENRLDTRIKNQNYSIRCVDSVHIAIQSAKKTKAQLAIFCHGSMLCHEPQQMEIMQSKPSELATLAIIKREEDRLTLLKAGIDECLHVHKCDELLFNSIERAMVGHAMRHTNVTHQLSGKALIVSLDNSRVNLVSYRLEESGYSFRITSSYEEAQRCSTDPFDLVLADYDNADPQEFRQIHELFKDLPIIALCDDISHGQQAIVNGASDYLCMPPRKEDIQRALDLVTSRMKASI